MIDFEIYKRVYGKSGMPLPKWVQEAMAAQEATKKAKPVAPPAKPAAPVVDTRAELAADKAYAEARAVAYAQASEICRVAQDLGRFDLLTPDIFSLSVEEAKARLLAESWAAPLKAAQAERQWRL
jgi:hypothetical protein